MEGELKNTTLSVLPSVLTDWNSWKKSHPQTTVIRLSRTGREFKNDYYKNLEDCVIGLHRSGRSKAWPYDQLKKQPILNDSFGREPILVYFEEQSSAAYVFERRLDQKVLTFAFAENRVFDHETNSNWDLAIGEAVSGKLKGAKLKPVPAIPSFRKSWLVFHPDSIIWQAPDK